MSSSRANYGEALILCGRSPDAESELREAIRLGPNNEIEATVLLAIAVYPRDADDAVGLALQGLNSCEQASISPFRHGELRSIARLLTGDADGAIAEVQKVADRWRPADHRQGPLYDLLRSLLTPGPVDAVLAVWPPAS